MCHTNLIQGLNVPWSKKGWETLIYRLEGTIQKHKPNVLMQVTIVDKI